MFARAGQTCASKNYALSGNLHRSNLDLFNKGRPAVYSDFSRLQDPNMILIYEFTVALGHSQNHLAVAGGCAAHEFERLDFVPPRYREVVLTVSKLGICSRVCLSAEVFPVRIAIADAFAFSPPQRTGLPVRTAEQNSAISLR